VTILESKVDDKEINEWGKLSLAHLDDAYGTDEPEYSISLVKEPNPDYKK